MSRQKGWLQKNYSVGDIIEVPHFVLPGMHKARITTFTTDNISHPGQATGIMVQFEADRHYMEIEAGYLNENGGGFV